MEKENIQKIVYEQPYWYGVKIGAETDSKGRVKPYAEVSIGEKLSVDEPLPDRVSWAVRLAKKRVVSTLKEMNGEFNGD